MNGFTNPSTKRIPSAIQRSSIFNGSNKSRLILASAWVTALSWSPVLFGQEGGSTPAGSSAATGDGTTQTGGIAELLPMFAMLAVVVYFMMIRPQRKQMKEHEELLNSLKKDDDVRTTSGIFGKVVSVDNQTNQVVLKIDEANNVKIRLVRSAIVEILNHQDKNQEAASS